MRIAICDDDSLDCEHLKSSIEEYAVLHGYNVTVNVFYSSKELLEEPKFDLYFLDFCLDDENGIELCRKLKEKYMHSVTVVFYTRYVEIAPRCINEVKPDGFLAKPLDINNLHTMIDKFHKTSLLSSNRIVLKRNKSYDTIYTRDIVFVEASGKNSVIYFNNYDETYPYLISELERDHLSPDLFIRTDRSYIVNMQYVSSFSNKMIRLKDGSQARLTRYEKFRDAYMDFLSKVIF